MVPILYKRYIFFQLALKHMCMISIHHHLYEVTETNK